MILVSGQLFLLLMPYGRFVLISCRYLVSRNWDNALFFNLELNSSLIPLKLFLWELYCSLKHMQTAFGCVFYSDNPTQD